MKKKVTKRDDEFTTKEELRNGLNKLEFQLIQRMDFRFESMRAEIRELKDMLQDLIDYVELEKRVVKLEQVVFPSREEEA